MVESLTPIHLLKKFDAGDNPGAENLNFNWDTISQYLIGRAVLTFPSTYPAGKHLLRSDQKVLYENTGTLEVPVWTAVLDGTGGGGGGGGTTISNYSGEITALADQASIDFTLEANESESVVLKGLAVSIGLDTASTGKVKVEFFSDPDRTILVRTIDPTIGTSTPATVPFPFLPTDLVGVMYARLTNLTGAPLTITVSAVILVVAASGTIGIITATPELAPVPGLRLDSLQRVAVKPGSGIEVDATGTKVDSTVIRTTGDQPLAGAKRFTEILGRPWHASRVGPPTTGTNQVGDRSVDTDGVEWECYTAGSPGSWMMIGQQLQESVSASFGSIQRNPVHSKS